ncbi:MAG: transglycosylase domain-containing protein, partial [Desulfobacterales bacterium]|nr:transglycosylase domain-containing protein [Desulfobacterales bacterium]
MISSGKKWIGVIVFTGLLAGLMVGAFSGLIYDLPEINHLKQFKPSAVSTVYSSDNKVISRFYLEKRFPIDIDAIPKNLVNALIVTEDRNFYSHSGVNLKAIARAIIHDIKAGGFKQGASTLTQQLAKTLFLSPEKSIVRKIREALLSIQIERRYTKDEILELYLNLIYLGSGAYGVEAAARTYFDTSASGLTLGQAALIAGLPKAPSIYSPLRNPELAKKRRAIVLRQMRDFGYITPKEHDKANAEPVVVESKGVYQAPAPFFAAYLKDKLEQQQGLAYGDGLSIHTTLNMKRQKIAERALIHQLDALKQRMEKNKVPTPAPQAALIALDVHTGAIRSMVGGRDYQESKFNRAVQAMRQPGSAFKPIVYAAAIEQGFEQNATLMDA